MVEKIRDVPIQGSAEKGRGRVITFGLYGGVLDKPEFGLRPSETHPNGAKAFRLLERAYQGGPSAADRMDS